MKKSSELKLRKASKKSLRTMQKNRTRHVVREKARIMKYGTKGFGRNFWLSMAATVVMAGRFFIFFVRVVASVILTSTAEMMKEKIDITIYFKPNTSQETLAELSRIISKDRNVKALDVSTSEEEYNKLLAENSENEGLLNVFDDRMKEIMINKLQATMRIKVYDVDNLNSIRDIVNNNEVFALNVDRTKPSSLDTNRAEIDTITSWAQIAQMGGMIFAGVFLVVSILVIFSTIRMAIFSRREEIYMMKLVGADKSFIRGPFLVEAELSGLAAGLIAATVSYFGFKILAPNLTEYGINVEQIVSVLDSNKLILVYLVFILIGVLIGRISARFAVSKYLKKM